VHFCFLRRGVYVCDSTRSNGALRTIFSVILRESGDTIYILAFFADPPWLYLIGSYCSGLLVRRRLYLDPGFYAPRVAVLCPCKRHRAGLERNLPALTEFDGRLRHFFSLSPPVRPGAQHRRADSFEFESEKPRDHRGIRPTPARSEQFCVAWNNCRRI